MKAYPGFTENQIAYFKRGQNKKVSKSFPPKENIETGVSEAESAYEWVTEIPLPFNKVLRIAKKPGKVETKKVKPAKKRDMTYHQPGIMSIAIGLCGGALVAGWAVFQIIGGTVHYLSTLVSI